MASIQRRGEQSFLIQFMDKNGRKRGISVSKIDEDSANDIMRRVEKINAANRAGRPFDRITEAWLKEQGDVMLKKLAKVDLIERSDTATIGDFIDEHFKSMVGRSGKGWKPQTLVRHEITKGHLLGFFKPSTPLTSITEADADAFARHLQNDVPTMKSNSTRYKHLSNVKTYFRSAVRHRLIAVNPFETVKLPKRSKKRFYFVTPEEADAVLQACPTTQWKLVFALARFGGLRMPSEIEKLTWGDIKWSEGVFLVRSPKTEHHEGKDKRFVPLFPELVDLLNDDWESLTDKQRQNKDKTFVVRVARKDGVLSGAYLRKRVLQIVENAGIKPWVKLFQNCRSTRQTELTRSRQLSPHEVCDIMGNSEKIAEEHYLQVTPEARRIAAKIVTSPATQQKHQPQHQPEELTDEKVMLKMMTQIEEVLGDDKQETINELRKLLLISESSSDCLTTPNEHISRVGVEPYLPSLKDW